MLKKQKLTSPVNTPVESMLTGVPGLLRLGSFLPSTGRRLASTLTCPRSISQRPASTHFFSQLSELGAGQPGVRTRVQQLPVEHSTCRADKCPRV